ncbi:MAG: pyroglutamyl-peptidase I [Planctomycetota bacterium]|jgi:pyroglutamyl-peptidase
MMGGRDIPRPLAALAALLSMLPFAGCSTREAPAARPSAPSVSPGPVAFGERSACETPATPVAAPEGAAPPRRRIVLVTGYEPFGGLETNTSWEVAKRVAGERVAGHEVVAVALPVVWEETRAKLAAAVREHEPDAVISMGVGWSGYVEVERVARNVRGQHKDNRGELPPAREVEPGGPTELRTRLPAGRIAECLDKMGLPARLSDSAGTYLCNEAFYALLRATDPDTPAGFIHLPRAGPDRARRPTRGEVEAGPVTVDGLAAGIRAAIEEAVGARIGGRGQ